ncbi:hypothetical protein [Rhizobium sp. NFR07]|uniref:hypothetical protein n=1 Tax=Rhizobium sp. NFR07 TaxID=1566262 RepID=UPI003298C3E1
MANDRLVVDRDDHAPIVAVTITIPAAITTLLAITASDCSKKIPSARTFEVRATVEPLATLFGELPTLVAPLLPLLAGDPVIGLGISIRPWRRSGTFLSLLGVRLLAACAVRIATLALAIACALGPLLLGTIQHSCTVFDRQRCRLFGLLLSSWLLPAFSAAGRLIRSRLAGCRLAVLCLLCAARTFSALALACLLLALARTLALRLLGVALLRLSFRRLLGILLALGVRLRLLGLSLRWFGLLGLGLLALGFLRFRRLVSLLLGRLLYRLWLLGRLFATLRLLATAIFLRALLTLTRAFSFRLLGVLLLTLARLFLRLLGLLFTASRLFAATFFLRALFATLRTLGLRLLGILLLALARLLLGLFGLLLTALRPLAAALFLRALLAALRALAAFRLFGVLTLATRLLATLALFRHDLLLDADHARHCK